MEELDRPAATPCPNPQLSLDAACTPPKRSIQNQAGGSGLSNAWTPKTADCGVAGRTTTNLDGAAPYWNSYTYTDAGQRRTEATHALAGTTTTSYEYGTKTGQPHPLAKTTGPKSASYGYDSAGNTTSRPGTQATQDLVWNTEGKLVSAAEPAAGTKPATGTRYLYDASGELLIRRSTKSDGDTVLYLGATEVRLSAKGATKTLTGTRYYGAAAQNIAVRTAVQDVTTKTISGTKLNFLAGDHHGTSGLAIDATTWAVTSKRYTMPFGASRGASATNWPDDKAFLGKPADTTTGLTHVGAREYDPATGQFISVDPLLQADIAQTLNGYSYGAQNPLSNTDPSGLGLPCGGNGAPEPCPMTPDGKRGTGRPNEGTGGGLPSQPHECNSSCGGGWQVEGVTGTDNDGNGKIAVYPGVDIPVRWKKTQQFIDFFYAKIREFCGPAATLDCYADPAFSTDIAVASAGACHAASCPAMGEMWGLYAGSVAAFGVLGGVGGRGGARGGNRKGSDCNKCFLAGTDVLMADGKTKDIEDVEVGDKVLARDPETGESGPREVTRLIVTEDDKHFNKLSIATDDGVRPLTATHEHPFWSPSEGQWVEAADLAPGMTLLTDTGDTVIVTANRSFTRHARTYNLTVDDLHTYYVLAGATPVLVHNSGGCGFGLDEASASGRKLDPKDKRGEFELAGNALSKHAGRASNSGRWPVPSGKRNPGSWNALGRDQLDDILTHPGGVASQGRGRINGQWQDVTDIRLPDGRGARFSQSGGFSGFLD
ncbi:polymorphic toxin-type HINT domain-containing protein [Streptomyces sp. A5-4]|uniref:polymorphic toxin-type HINT domain-containing protein n=1 Tax=Streptomyces sp. A5-4 TaxID=3384771 RepID=UPI003DA9AEBA